MAGYGALKNALRLNKSKLTRMVIHMPTEKTPIRVDHHFADGGVKKFPFEGESGADVAKHIESHIAADEGHDGGVDGSGDSDNSEGESTPSRAGGKPVDEPKNPLRLRQGRI